MMRSNFFRRHLYNQIVIPLVLASVLVGVIAIIVANFFMMGLTDRWIDQVAQGTIQNLESRLNSRAVSMTRIAKLASEDSRLKDALDAGDFTQLRGLLVQNNVALSFDNMMMLDSDGAVIATTGLQGLRTGDAPLGGQARSYANLQMPHAMFLDLDGRLTLTALQPIMAGDSDVYTLAVSTLIDDTFLDDLQGGTGQAFLLYDSDRTAVASSVQLGDSASPADVVELTEAVDAPDPAIERALLAASDGTGRTTLKLDGGKYRVWAERVRLNGDPVDSSYGYLVSIVSQAVSDEAGQTTFNLISMWSVIAVLALVGLGGWVARRVSDPLVELAEGAGRIADGDFTTKIPVSGGNEIANLSESFNSMTDALRERSESLTKKVLELATLYEMSRALGSTLEMDVLLDSVLDSAMRIFNVELGYVTLRGRDSGQLELRAHRGRDIQPHDDEALRNSMSEWVVREGRPLIFNPPRGEGEAQVDTVTGALSALCVPLVSGEGTLGAITVGSHEPDFRFTSDDVRLLSTIANHVTIAIGNIELFSSLQEAYLATVRSLAAAVDAKDPFTRGHSDRVAGYSTMIAERMGLSHEQQTALEMAAYLHDIGKIGIREEILLKPGSLTEDEMVQMRHHPLIGANILKPVGFPWPITPIVRHHHEKWDGTGYPAGLKGEEIPTLARILTVSDAFEAMTADRPYRSGRTLDGALLELRRCAGSHFDPRVVDALVEAIEEHGPITVDDTITELQEIGPEETRAIFVALAEGMLGSFRKLGGPRLANNVEQELTEAFRSGGLPFSIVGGRLVMDVDALDPDDEGVQQMRDALRAMDEAMGRTSGHSLVDHFYADALLGLSERMRRSAGALRFYGS